MANRPAATKPTTAAFQLFPPLTDREYEALRIDIAERGVLVPVEVDQDGQVLDGHHRLRIAEELGIECPRLERSFKTDDERTAHIIALNLKRRHLDPLTWGRMFRELAKARGVHEGRPKKGENPAKTAGLAEELGVSERTARERVSAADAADAYPFMQGWKPYRILEAKEHLEALPEDTRETMSEMLSEPAIPPTTAISMLANVRRLPKKQQREISALYQSEDDRDRTLAKTKAAELPAAPDKRRIELMQIERQLRACINWYPDDALVPSFERIIEAVKGLQDAIKQQQEGRQDGH